LAEPTLALGELDKPGAAQSAALSCAAQAVAGASADLRPPAVELGRLVSGFER